MFHLVEDTIGSIENNLIYAGKIRDSWFSMWFNIIILVVVVGSFIYFLYSSYGKAPPPELKAIKYEPVPWMNAVRNVPSSYQDYGQLPQTEIGSSVQGVTYRTSASTI